MNYWLISDTHFNHQRLEEWGDRAGDWQERIWKGIQAIPPQDILIHLGDICIGDDAEVHGKLLVSNPRKKVLVLGNHDKKSKQWYQEHGWDFVCDGLELIYMGYYLWLSHRPQPEFGHITQNIHGHTHGNMHRSEEYVGWYDNRYHKDISPELVGFTPIRLDTLIKSWKATGQ